MHIITKWREFKVHRGCLQRLVGPFCCYHVEHHLQSSALPEVLVQRPAVERCSEGQTERTLSLQGVLRICIKKSTEEKFELQQK